MIEGFDELTPEEKALVQCLKGWDIPADDKPVGSSMPLQKKETREHAPGDADQLQNNRALAGEPVMPLKDDRSLETIISELNQSIRDDVHEVRFSAQAVLQSGAAISDESRVKELKELLCNVETSLLKMAEIREKINDCIQIRQRLEAAHAVKKMVSEGLECRRIQIDDICFEVNENNDVQMCNRP